MMPYCMRRLGGFLMVMVMVIGSGGDGLADTVKLKNGGSFEGLILQEDAQNIELQVGPGTMRIRQSQVRSIERSSPLEQF